MTQGVRTALQRLQAACAEPQLVLLDVGVATRLSDNEQRTMVGLFSAFGDLDGRATAERVLEFAGEVRQRRDQQTLYRYGLWYRTGAGQCPLLSARPACLIKPPCLFCSSSLQW